MRVLLTCRSTLGHWLPLRPIGDALVAAGHEVGCATGPSLRGQVEAAGMAFWPAGPEMLSADERQQLVGAGPWPSPMHRRVAHFSRLFVDYELPLRLPALAEVVESWEPDLLVHESAEFAGPIAATAAGVPHATHSFGDGIDPAIVAGVAEASAPHWSQCGLAPHPRGGLWQHLYLDNWPRSLQRTAPLDAPAVQPIRPVTRTTPPPDAGEAVYVTLGTVYNSDYQLFTTILKALSRLRREVIVTVGDNGNPSQLRGLSRSIRVERFIPQEEVLPHCALVVGHGGAGTTLGALAYGCPILFLPQAADQHHNAAAVTEAGAGLTATPDARTEDGLHAMAAELLGQPSYRDAARRLSEEIATMPSPHAAVERLTALVSAGR